MPPDAPLARQWLAFAEEDPLLATSPCGDNPFARGLRAFHCQQVAEKAIKAILVLHGVLVPRTHNISDLIDALPMTGPAVAQRARHLSSYAAASRYPDELLEVSAEDLAEAIEASLEVLVWARTAMGSTE